MPSSREGKSTDGAHLPAPVNPTDAGAVQVLGPVRQAYDVTPLPPALVGPPNPWTLALALLARWPLVLTAGLLCATVAGAVTWFYLVPAHYNAEAKIHIASNAPKVLFTTAEGRPDFASYQRTQLALVRSRFVLNAALRQPKVAELSLVKEQEDPTGWLTKEMRLDYTLSPEILRISLRGERPEELVIVVNAVTDAYLQEIVNKEQVQQQARADRLKQIYSQYEENLRGRRKTLRELAESAGSDNVETLTIKQRLAIEQMGMSQRELLQLQSDLRRLQIEVGTREGRLKQLEDVEVPPTVIEDYLKTDPVALKHQKREAALEESITRVLRVARASQAERLAARHRQELKTVKRAKEVRRKELMPTIVKRYREKLKQEWLTSSSLQSDRLTVMQRLEKQLTVDINRLANETQVRNRQSLDLGSLRDEIGQGERVAQSVAAELEKLRVEALAPARIQLLEAAETPKSRDTKRKTMTTAGAAIGALLLVLGGMAVWEHRARKMYSADDVARGLGLRLVGELPRMPDRVRRAAAADRPARDRYWRSVMAESVDATRTMLMHAAHTERLRVVMITSALPGEGKTTLAGHLALSLARAGRRTVLVDCDLRKPAAHRLFNLSPEIGLSEVLRDEVDLEEAILPTLENGPFVLPAGCCDPTATLALAQHGIRDIFDHLKTTYDFVIVDSPPVLSVADSLLVSQRVDAVLFATLRNVSRLPAVHAAYERLSILGVRILGLVASGVRCHHYGRKYHSYVRSDS